MADLDFKHHVSEIPRGEALPAPVQRTVKPEVSNIPNYQGAVNQYAADTNWMSTLGSAVATRSSNAIASKLGYELGKNPQGELPPAFTETDAEFRRAYDAQAQATLGLQAHKLISQSNIELASSPRLDTDTISKSQQSVLRGLDKIISLAPESVRPQMESQYGGLMIQQNETLIHRMTTEQKSDRQERLKASSKTNAENAYALAFNGINEDKNGDSKAGLDAVHTQINAANSALAIHDITEEERNTIIETAWKSYYSGKLNRQAMQADREKKLPEFTKSLAENPPKDIPLKYRDAVYQNVLHTIQQQQQLRSLDENYQVQEMRNRILVDPHSISDGDFLEFQSQVSPLKASQTKFHLLQALKQKDKESVDMTNLITNWGNSEVQVRAGDKLRNQTFDYLVARTVSKSNGNKNSDDAQVEVALSAGSPVGVFIDGLNKKLTSGNPISILSASTQVQKLRDVEGGHALIGLSKQAEAITTLFKNQRGSMDDSDLARKITDNVLNIDDSLQKTLDNSWNIKLSTSGAGGLGGTTSLAKFALKQVKIDPDDLGGKYFETIYGNDIYNQLRANFDATRGDYDAALEMTKNYVNQNYGDSFVNGEKQVTDRPIEKVLGYKTHDVVPFVQEDLLNQMNKKFLENKNENDYWTVKPVKFNDGLVVKKYYPAEVIRHVKTGNGEKLYSYPVNLIGRPDNEWDIVVKTPGGNRSLFLVAPNFGIVTYKPDEASIRTNFEKHQKNRGWF